jgi:hypothetical protein
MIVKLSEPTQINGTQVTEIDLKLEKLKGKELLELSSGFKKYRRGEFMPVVELEREFQAFVAGHVSGYNPEDLAELLAPDYIDLCTTVQNFLLKSGSQGAAIQLPKVSLGQS